MKEKRYTSGEIAAAAGLTIRTVQHYDNIGLLRSAGRTEGGRRYYTQDDLIRLEQILLYKSLGFSLKQIKKQLLFRPSRQELLEMFKTHQLLLLEKMEQLHTSFAALGLISGMIGAGREVSFTLLLQFLSALPGDDIFSRAPQMLTEKEKDILSARFQDLDTAQPFYHKLKEFLIEAMILMNEGLSPADAEVQNLVRRWWETILAFTEGDMELVRELSKLHLEDRLAIKNVEMLSRAKEFMETAFRIYSAENSLLSDRDEN
ncbi:MAG: MerR family transcriptional regulator [Peptostreptococcaceae bacterium]|nr:MerR family transcriptional regulator [Peptostreptococcaceae bacterium]